MAGMVHAQPSTIPASPQSFPPSPQKPQQKTQGLCLKKRGQRRLCLKKIKK